MDNGQPEHESWGEERNGSDSWDSQFEDILDRVSDHWGLDPNELRNDDAYLADYEKAFGLEQGENHLHGTTFDDPKEYAEFLSDWLDYDHDEIDYALGYDED